MFKKRNGHGVGRRRSIRGWVRMSVLAAAAVLVGSGLIVGPQRECVAQTVGSGAKKPPAKAVPSAAAAAKAKGDVPKPIVGKNSLILPITTDLQRARGPKYPDASALVLMNGMALINEDDTVLYASALDLKGLREALENYPRVGKRGNYVFHVCLGPVLRPQGMEGGASTIFKIFLDAWGTHFFPGSHVELTGFRRGMDASKWDSFVADLTAQPAQGDAQDEPGLGDDQVRVYPVRTPFSRYLYGEDVDCVIRIIPPVEKAKASAVFMMQQCVGQLKLESRRRVAFLIQLEKTGASTRAMIEEFCGEHVEQLLGFKTSMRIYR